MSDPTDPDPGPVVLLDWQAEEVSISAPGATVILSGPDQIREVRDQLSAHLHTLVTAQEPDPHDPGDPWPQQGWHSQSIPSRGGGINV